jgi:sterol desaturase/sphingolipid hydroxylase (fatty acid hydroxylase superfamily)
MSVEIVSKRDETTRLFANPVLEYLSHIHPATPLAAYLPVIGIVGYASFRDLPLAISGIAFWSGVLLWTFTEYALHRWVFHYQPTSRLGRRVHFLVHGIHHAYPRDSTRLVMPLMVSAPLAAMFWGLFGFIFGPWRSGVFAGFLFGYLCYDMIHYATHHLPMRSRLGRALRRYHMNHHFVDDDTAYGVSNPLWDVIFATTPKDQSGKNDAT